MPELLQHLVRDVTAPPDEEPLPYVALEHLESGMGRLLEDVELTNRSSGGAGMVEFSKGDVLFGKLRPYLAKSWVADRRGCASTELIVMRPERSVDTTWLSYVVQSRELIDWAVASAEGVKMPRTSWERLRKFRVAVPPKQDQRRIADFLDAETARIDGLIRSKRRMVNLLDRRFQTLTTELLFARPTSSSVRIGRVVDLLPGFAFASQDFVGCDHGAVRLLRGINVTPGAVRWSDVACVDPGAAASYREYELRPGDLVLGMDRPFVSSGLRIATVTETDTPCLLVQRVARIRPLPTMNADFVRLALASDAFVAYFEPILTGVSVPHISPDQIKSFRIPLPPRWEQDKIAAALTHTERQQGALCKRLGRQIELLKERRQALITAAVTGELDVTKGAA